MGKQDKPICALLIGNAATAQKADKIATAFSDCPYATLYTSSDRLVLGVYIMPESKRWWIEVPQEEPQLLGLERLRVFFTDQIEAASPWSLGIVKPELKLAPCKADCVTCPLYLDRCQGCPATVFYKAGS